MRSSTSVACQVVDALAAAADWPVGAVAVGVVGHGSFGDTARPFAWASVTKLLTTMAALVAVEEGTLALDDELRRLLSHARGDKRVYGNDGMEEVARRLADAAGMPFDEYLRAGVLEPLGMASTAVDGSPASGAVGPLDDLLRLGAELLSPTIVDRATLDDATTVQFPGLRGVLPGFGMQDPNDWGLGFELRDDKSPHWTGSRNSPRTFGHFGQSGSFLWVDPDAGVACACLTDTDFGPWARTAWPALADAVLSELGAAPARPSPRTT